MNQAEQIQYLANIFYISRIDNNFDVKEDELLEQIAKGIGGGYLETRKALDMSMEAGFQIKLPNRLSDQMRNLEDMLFLALSDNKVDTAEKKIIIDFANRINISKEQFDLIKKQVSDRVRAIKLNS